MPLTWALGRRGLTARDFDRPVPCWAGVRIAESYGGPACVCRITEDLITAAQNPSSLAAYCMGDYQGCPVWRDAKERKWQGRPPVTEDEDRPVRWRDQTGETLDLESLPVTSTES